ncbi:MAG TPA: winged helix-turn-helix domain-containing protein [Sphingomicrobium sp.]|nr:winged helix-turn-helix domain-containing protein [Sphingomicrobium sp.]
MDRAISLDARRIELSIELPFQLGDARVDPRSHEVAWNDESRRLQPQTVKVLVALHDKLGDVVTRDELVDRCWDGRFVGEDVINRCISLLRRVAGDSGGFEIQTVPRAGYRLIEAPPSAAVEEEVVAADEPAAPASPRERYWALAISAGLAIVVAAGGLFAFERFSEPKPDAVMLTPFDVAGNAPLARTFAAGVSAEVNSALSAAGVDVLEPDSSGQSKAEFVLSGHAELPDSNLHLTAELQDSRDHSLLWSTTFTRPAAQAPAMQEQVAANLAAVLHCALDTSRQLDGEQLDQGTIKLYLKACALEQAVDPPSDQIETLLQQVTTREPRFAEGWARLAFFSANAAFYPDSEQPALRRQARAAAQTAIGLNPRSSLAHQALAELDLGHVPFAQIYRDAQINRTLDPSIDSVAGDGSELLLRMGRLDEGLERARRGVALDPFSPVETADLITALIDDGHLSEAGATVERAVRVWPDDTILQVVNLDYQARFGDPNAALAIVNDPAARPEKVRDVTLAAYRHLAEARKANGPAQTRAFIAWLKQEVVSGQLGVDFAAPHLAQFGDVDDAFRLALAAPADITNIDPAFLWTPEALRLRRDHRFVTLASKFYVAAFWRQTGLWPDFCSTPGWPYDCKAEAARLPLNAWPKPISKQQ